MAKFRKVALKPDTYHSPDGTVEITRERLQHWQQNFRRMSQAGYTIPISWDHADTEDGILPLSVDDFRRARSAKNTIGRLSAISLNAGADGAVLEFDVSDPLAEGRANRNEIFVSPVIKEYWRDGAGNEYRDVITHVDFVDHPVDHSQSKFARIESGSIACAIRMGLSGGVFRMAADDKAEDEDETPDFLDGGDADADMGDGADAGGEDDFAPDDAETVLAAQTEEETPNPDLPKDSTADADAAAEAEAIVAHLSQLGVELPAAWNFQTDAAGAILLAALKTASRAKTDQAAAQAPAPTDQAAPPDPGAMSATDPGYATMSIEGRYAERMHREELKKKLETLLITGRIMPVEFDARMPALKAVRLSLDNTGKPKTGELEAWIKSREPVPQGTFWSPEQRTKMSLTPVEPKAGLMGEEPETEEHAEAVADEVFRKPKPAKAAKKK